MHGLAVVTREKFKYILDTYDSYDKAVFIRSNQRLALLQLRCLRSNLGYCKQMLQDGIIFEVWGMMAYAPRFVEENTDYIMAMRKAYGLSENVSPEFHRVMLAEVTSIPNFSEICGRCVVLYPYSSTLKVEKGGGYFFEQICLLLKEKGYFVYTNVIKNQKPVPGSLPLRCSLEEMLGIASKIPFMVSLRSGICDFLVPSGLNMFVIYNKLWFYIWFRLKSWEGKGTLEELYYEESAGEEESQRLVEAFKGYLAKIEREKGIFFDGHGG